MTMGKPVKSEKYRYEKQQWLRTSGLVGEREAVGGVAAAGWDGSVGMVEYEVDEHRTTSWREHRRNVLTAHRYDVTRIALPSSSSSSIIIITSSPIIVI